MMLLIKEMEGKYRVVVKITYQQSTNVSTYFYRVSGDLFLVSQAFRSANPFFAMYVICATMMTLNSLTMTAFKQQAQLSSNKYSKQICPNKNGYVVMAVEQSIHYNLASCLEQLTVSQLRKLSQLCHPCQLDSNSQLTTYHSPQKHIQASSQQQTQTGSLVLEQQKCVYYFVYPLPNGMEGTVENRTHSSLTFGIALYSMVLQIYSLLQSVF